MPTPDYKRVQRNRRNTAVAVGIVVVVFLIVASSVGRSHPKGGGNHEPAAQSSSPWTGETPSQECAKFREYGVSNSQCEETEEVEVEGGFEHAEREEEAERRSSPSGESKWEELDR